MLLLVLVLGTLIDENLPMYTAMRDFINLLSENPSEIDFSSGPLVSGNDLNSKLIKFTVSKNSVEPDEVSDDFLWEDTKSFVEVYKLPNGMRWPTHFCSKQLSTGSCEEFNIRRMNSLHRYRVSATLQYLWGPSDGKIYKIIWAGSPGAGKVLFLLSFYCHRF